MRILVTGGTGFIGSWIVRALVARGDSVRVLHRPSSDASALAGVEFEPTPGDVTDLESIKAAAKGVDAIVHAAGVVAHSPADLPLLEKVNVGGTANVIDAALASDVKRLVHVSSVVTVGASRSPRMLDEQSVFDPKVVRSRYALTKRRAEELVLEACSKRSLDAVCVNPSVVFGPGDAVKGSRKTHLKVAAGRWRFMPPGGANVVHIDDVVAAHLAALDRGRAGERYIVGGENLYIADLFRMLAAAGGSAPPPIPVPSLVLRGYVRAVEMASWFGLPVRMATDSFRNAAIFHWYDNAKARRELGVTFRPVQPAVEASVRWAKERGLC